METKKNIYLPSFCRYLYKTVWNYLQDAEHQKQFEEWYLEKYGKPYQWKRGYPFPETEKERN